MDMLLSLILLPPPPLTFTWNGRPIPLENGVLVGLEPGARWTVDVHWIGDLVRLTISRDGLTWDEPDLDLKVGSVQCYGWRADALDILRVVASP